MLTFAYVNLAQGVGKELAGRRGIEGQHLGIHGGPGAPAAATTTCAGTEAEGICLPRVGGPEVWWEESGGNALQSDVTGELAPSPLLFLAAGPKGILLPSPHPREGLSVLVSVLKSRA